MCGVVPCTASNQAAPPWHGYLLRERFPVIDSAEVLLGVRPDLLDGAGGHQCRHGLPLAPLEEAHTAEKRLMLLPCPFPSVQSNGPDRSMWRVRASTDIFGVRRRGGGGGVL